VRELPGIELVNRQVATLAELDEPHVLLATGPLTADALAADLGARVGQGHLAFYDAIAPIVDGDSLDLGRVFFASRYGKGEPDAYANCPMNEAEYHAFVAALTEADQLTPRAFEDERYFDGCQPVEQIAKGGVESLAHGPMRPVGLTPPDGSRPYAVVQLRREDAAGRAFNLVGFQTRLRHPDQVRLFRTIPGLEDVRFLRLGSIHRNTFVDHPAVADASLRLKAEPRVRLAGQITGVEGYIESTASGYLSAMALLAELAGRPFVPPQGTTALGGLYRHVTTSTKRFQPTNAHLGLLDAIPWRRGVKKPQRRLEYGERALADFEAWITAEEKGES
jgi:methylenetetrahydrofolate--tRNA-(uracil-5-)-methyltransferase